MKLISLPDFKGCHAFLTIGKEYAIVKTIGNGVVIVTDNPDMTIVILRSRFE